MSLASDSDRDFRVALLAGYLLLLVVLIAGSEIRRVGDGGEYLDMATDLLRFETPSVYAHFWLYSALATPFLALVQLTPLDAFAAFLPVNLALLGTAFWVASGVLRWPALALVFFSPIIWWVDKAHTEVFTFSLLTIAFVGLKPFGAVERVLHPGWAVLCLAIAGTQNPPFLVLAPLAAIWLVATKTANVDDRTFVAFCAAATIMVALHPAYYYFTIGRLSGLTGATHGRLPNLDELWVVIGDTNIGVIPNAPVFVLAAAVIVGTLLFQAPRRLIGADTAFAIVTGALLLASFSQTKNYNHGGTPMMSRYALWLIPLMVPFLRQAGGAVAPRLHRATVSLTALSCAWSLATFHPDRPEVARASQLATWIWAHHPSLDRPLPEVFVERVRASERPWRLPVATADCTKLLLMGRGDTRPVWPFPCFPETVPPQCLERNAFCYANRRGSTYEFTRLPTPSYSNYKFEPEAVWTQEQSKTARALLMKVRWWEMSICETSSRRLGRGEFGVAGPPHYCGPDRLLAFFGNSGGAEIPLRLRKRMSGAFIDGSTGQVVSFLTCDGEPGELSKLTIPVGPQSVFLVLTETGLL